MIKMLKINWIRIIQKKFKNKYFKIFISDGLYSRIKV